MDVCHPAKNIRLSLQTLPGILWANLVKDVRIYSFLEERGKLFNVSCAFETKIKKPFLFGSLKQTKGKSKISTTLDPANTHHLLLIVNDDIINEDKNDPMLTKEP